MIYRMRFGTLHIGRFDGSFRRDVWERENTGERFCEPALAVGPDDLTPRHNGMNSGYGGNYDPRCSACWLHHTHTEAYHRQSVGLDIVPPHSLTLAEFRAAWGAVYGEWTDQVRDRMCAAARAAAL